MVLRSPDPGGMGPVLSNQANSTRGAVKIKLKFSGIQWPILDYVEDGHVQSVDNFLRARTSRLFGWRDSCFDIGIYLHITKAIQLFLDLLCCQ